MDEIGPVDYAVIAFPGNQFEGDIAPAIADLIEAGTIRLIDAAFVSKDEHGEVVMMEITQLAPDVQAKLESLHIEAQGLLSEDDEIAIGAELELNSSAAILVWENVWARRVAQTIREAGGMLLAFERIPHVVVQAAREAILTDTNA